MPTVKGEPAEFPATEVQAYPVASEWTDDKIFKFLTSNAISIPEKTPKGVHFVSVKSSSLGYVQLPTKYRIPLLWTIKYQWHSLYLVLTSANRKKEWEEYRLSILHVSIVCHTLLQVAKASLKGSKSDRKWRYPMFDGVLARYWDRYLVNDPDTIEAYQEELVGFKDDILKYNWKSWTTNSDQDFALTFDEIDNGISAKEFMSGLTSEGGVWKWVSEPDCIYSLADKDLTKKGKLAKAVPPSKKPSKPQSEVQVVKSEAEITTITTPAPSSVPPKSTVKLKVPKSSTAPVSKPEPSAGQPKLPATTVSTDVSASASIKKPSLPHTSNPNAPPTRLLESMQSQLNSLFDIVESVKAQNRQARQEQVKLQEEYAASQSEIRDLKRQLETPQISTLIKKRKVENLQNAEPSDSTMVGVSSYHPLSHLLEVE